MVYALGHVSPGHPQNSRMACYLFHGAADVLQEETAAEEPCRGVWRVNFKIKVIKSIHCHFGVLSEHSKAVDLICCMAV